MSEHVTARQVLSHLAQTYGRSRSIWAAIGITAASSVISKLVVPILFAKWLVAVAAGSAESTMTLVAIAAAYGLAIALAGLGDFVFIKRSDELYEKLVGRFYDLAMLKRLGFFRDASAGELSNLFRHHLDGTINLFRLLRTEIFPIVSMAIGAVIIIASYSPIAALIFLAASVLRGYLSYLAIDRIRPLKDAANRVYNRLSGTMGDQMANSAVVKASGNVVENRQNVTKLAAEEARLFSIRHRTSARYDALGNVSSAIGFIGLLWMASNYGAAGAARLELAVLALVFAFQGLQAAQTIGDLQQRLASRWESVVSSLRRLGSTELGSTLQVAPVSQMVGGSIEFRDVGFSYEGSRGDVVFEGVNITIRSGSHVAVVGKNGAGKSTLINLIMRFDRPTSGSVAVADRDVEDWDDQSFYKSVSYVPQDYKLFNTTVLDNVLFYERHPSSERRASVWRALKIDELAAELNDGLETNVGEMGGKLSGGQRQLVAIARALLRDAEIYIFDEPTSALRSVLSKELVRELLRLLHDKTLVFVTHSEELADMFPDVLEVSEEQVRWVRSREGFGQGNLF